MTSIAVREIPLEDEYKKDTGITQEDIKKLRQWIKTQPHLPAEYITDLDLILAYHCCDRSSEVAKQMLERNFTSRTLFTGLFKDRRLDKKVEHCFTNTLLKPLTTRSKEGYAGFYTRLIETDPKNFVVMDHARALMMVIDLWQYEEGSWPGMLLLMDFEGVSLGHLSKFDFQAAQQFLYFLQEAMFIKFKGCHALNAPNFIDKLLSLIKPFLKTEFLDMIHIHQRGHETLKPYYPIEGLPKETGGNYMTVIECRDEVLSKVKNSPAYFEKENKKRVDESLRPGKPKTMSDVFGGVEGSFKKLNID